MPRQLEAFILLSFFLNPSSKSAQQRQKNETLATLLLIIIQQNAQFLGLLSAYMLLPNHFIRKELPCCNARGAFYGLPWVDLMRISSVSLPEGELSSLPNVNFSLLTGFRGQ